MSDRDEAGSPEADAERKARTGASEAVGDVESVSESESGAESTDTVTDSDSGSDSDSDSAMDTATDTAGSADEEARAARDAIEAAKAAAAAQPAYPTPDARTQRLAGWGCLLLLVLLSLGSYLIFSRAFSRLTMLDTNLNGYDFETWVPDAEEQRQSRPRERRAAPSGESVAWRTEIGAAIREARDTGRPLLVHFEAPYARASLDMIEGTYANASVKALLESFVALRVDHSQASLDPEIAELIRRYGVDALPHVLYLSPDGERLRSDSTSLVDAADMEVFLMEAWGSYQDGRRHGSSAGAADGAETDGTENDGTETGGVDEDTPADLLTP